MAQASKKDRQIRKLKRERTIAFRLVNRLVIERNQARLAAATIEQELKLSEAKQLNLSEAKQEVPGTNKITALLEAEKEPSESDNQVN